MDANTYQDNRLRLIRMIDEILDAGDAAAEAARQEQTWRDYEDDPQFAGEWQADK